MLQLDMYPSVEDAPEELKRLSGPCGPISVWMVLARHKIQAAPSEIIKACKYSDEYGCFAVCMAFALEEFGLAATLHTDADPSPKSTELQSYAKVRTAPAASLSMLLHNVDAGASVILSYVAFGGEGHFSPLAGARANRLLLPYSTQREMLRSEFGKRWRANGILRQAVVAT